MVKNAMDSSLGVSLTVSAVCCPVEAGEDPAGIARYVQALSEELFWLLFDLPLVADRVPA